MNNNKGFTLIELLIASLITSVIVTFVALILIRVTKLNNQLKAVQETDQELRIIDKAMDVWFSKLNQEENVSISFSSSAISKDDDTKIVKEDNKLTINGKDYDFSIINDIEFSKANNHLIVINYSFNNKTITKNYYIIGGIS